jgi:hypothetical protein
MLWMERVRRSDFGSGAKVTVFLGGEVVGARREEWWLSAKRDGADTTRSERRRGWADGRSSTEAGATDSDEDEATDSDEDGATDSDEDGTGARAMGAVGSCTGGSC